ncbi:serine/threonine-protein kinase [Bailinhaonella thermotolerans]|nr:serine/threonine-protein kinase [Bailinhaonella thermotolerans]
MPEAENRVLAGRYELLNPVGRGSMGTVWKARDQLLHRDVAVKEVRFPANVPSDQRAELCERTVREARTAAQVDHTAVVTIFDVVVEDDRPWIIMEFIEAQSLEQIVEAEGPLPARLVAEMGEDLLSALRTAHEKGVLHRDVKPGNVLITNAGRVVLTDFGIAKLQGEPGLTRTGMVIGSPGYTAPERARGEYTGPESDLWSLGATLYYAVEGRPAYERPSVMETIAALLSEEVDPPTQAESLKPVLEGLLRKDPERRITTEVAAMALRVAAQGRTLPDTLPEPDPKARPERPKPEPKPEPRSAEPARSLFEPKVKPQPTDQAKSSSDSDSTMMIPWNPGSRSEPNGAPDDRTVAVSLPQKPAPAPPRPPQPPQPGGPAQPPAGPGGSGAPGAPGVPDAPGGRPGPGPGPGPGTATPPADRPAGHGSAAGHASASPAHPGVQGFGGPYGPSTDPAGHRGSYPGHAAQPHPGAGGRAGGPQSPQSPQGSPGTGESPEVTTGFFTFGQLSGQKPASDEMSKSTLIILVGVAVIGLAVIFGLLAIVAFS